MKSCLASHLARKCSIGVLPSLRNQYLTQDCFRGPPSLERTPGHNTQPRAVRPFDSTTHLVRGPQLHLSHNEGKWKGRAGDPGFAGERISGKGGRAVPSSQDRDKRTKGRGTRCSPHRPPPERPSPALRPACPCVDPSLARLARGRSGARARPRADQGEAVAPGARPRTCQTRGASLELRVLHARGRPRRPAAPGRAVRAGPTKPAGGEEMSGGPAAAPQVDVPPPRGAVASPSRPCAPPPHPTARASELVDCDGAPLIYNVFRFPQDGEGCAAVPSGTGAPVK